jgi:hypothetical protein
MFDQRGELPLLPFENPIGFVPASRGRVYIEISNNRRDAESAENFPFAQSGDGDWAKTTALNLSLSEQSLKVLDIGRKRSE